MVLNKFACKQKLTGHNYRVFKQTQWYFVSISRWFCLPTNLLLLARFSKPSDWTLAWAPSECFEAPLWQKYTFSNEGRRSQIRSFKKDLLKLLYEIGQGLCLMVCVQNWEDHLVATVQNYTRGPLFVSLIAIVSLETPWFDHKLSFFPVNIFFLYVTEVQGIFFFHPRFNVELKNW